MKEQEREKIKAMNLHGEELFEYCLCKTNDRELSSIAHHFIFNDRPMKKKCEYLERIIYNNKNVVFYYPMWASMDAKYEDEIKAEIKGKEYIGNGYDGEMYL